VATSGTHDTEPMVIWWENAPRDEREAVLAIPSVRERLAADDHTRLLDQPGLPHPIREALLEVLFASGANLLILPVQDVFGWRDRINQPATIGEDNWTWRLPWPSDRLQSEPQALAIASQLREWARRHRR
jgi:4-alpha-glucanotransferase